MTEGRHGRQGGARGAVPEVSGLVLAGGRSRRFGSNKLAVIVEGRPLLHLPVLALAEVCDEVLVAIAPYGPRPSLPQPGHGRGPGRADVKIGVVRDAAAGLGPLAGVRAGLGAARAEVVVVAAGDMPSLQPAVLRALVTGLADEGVAATALVEDGTLRPLPCALRRAIALPVVERLLASGRASLVGLLDAIQVRGIDPSVWRTLDPDGLTLRDIDRRDGLDRRDALGRR